MTTKACDHFGEFKNKPFVGFNTVLVAILALVSIALQVKYYLKIGKVYNTLRDKYRSQSVEV